MKKKEIAEIYRSANYEFKSCNFSEAAAIMKEHDDVKDPELCFIWGMLYFFGLGTTKNQKKAFECFDVGAKQKYPASMMMTAVCYENGFGTLKNLDLAEALYSKGIKMINKLLKKKDSDAYFVCGTCSLNGWGTEKSLLNAIDYFNSSAVYGNMYAEYCCLKGIKEYVFDYTQKEFKTYGGLFSGFDENCIDTIYIYISKAKSGSIVNACKVANLYRIEYYNDVELFLRSRVYYGSRAKDLEDAMTECYLEFKQTIMDRIDFISPQFSGTKLDEIKSIRSKFNSLK